MALEFYSKRDLVNSLKLLFSFQRNASRLIKQSSSVSEKSNISFIFLIRDLFFASFISLVLKRRMGSGLHYRNPEPIYYCIFMGILVFFKRVSGDTDHKF